MSKEILDVLMELRLNGQPHAVATVIETKGSVSAKTGSKAIIDHDGFVIAGWVGGGCSESITCHEALKNMVSGNITIVDIDMDGESLNTGIPCGGSMRVYVEPVLPKPSLWIMGHGRVAECLCQMGSLMGLTVVVNDPDVEREKFPDAEQLITDDINYNQLQPSADDYVVIATQQKGDHDSIKKALHTKAGYIALIASRKRARLVMEFLHEEGFTTADLARVMAPAGLDLGARTPEEIALCLISEIVLVRRSGTGMRMYEKLKLWQLASTR